MKRCVKLLLVAGLVLGSVTGASAIDFKAKGQWIMSFDYGDNSTFARAAIRGGGTNRAGYANTVSGPMRGSTVGSYDNFSAQQRVRLQLDAVASEALSGTVFFEIGDQLWGGNGTNSTIGGGAALGADGTLVEVKRAYLDWIVPHTDLKVRMGLQGVAMPAFPTGGSQVLDDDVAGIVLSYKFNETVSATLGWLRLYNDNYPGSGGSVNFYTAPAAFMDNFDLFTLLLPLSFDGVKVTPWAMVGGLGPKTFETSNRRNSLWMNTLYFSNFNPGLGNSGRSIVEGMHPAAVGLKNGKVYKSTEYTMPFWLGLTGDVTLWDPFRLAWDFNYGDTGAQYTELRRSGWYASLLGEYKLDWGTPGLYFWYSSGDDDNPNNGSERMPRLRTNGDNQFSHYAGNGNPYIAREGVLGTNVIGTWGIGARLKDMSFFEDLTHTVRVNYFGGTNSPGMVKYLMQKQNPSGRIISQLGGPRYMDFNSLQELYLTTSDSAMEFGLTTSYKIYENLTVMLDAAYVALWLDQSSSMWGGGGFRSDGADIGSLSTCDAWNVNVSFVYQF